MTSTASEKRFSRFLAWTLVVLEGVSLTLVVGVLYGIMSRTMTQEFHNRLKAEQAEVSMILQDRLNLLETKLLDVSLNNAVRVSLMLGVKSQLREIVERQYPELDGARFFVKGAKDSQFIPELPKGLDFLSNRLIELDQKGSMQKEMFKKFSQDEFFSIYSIPIRRKKERLGTAYAVYNISKDGRFWERLSTSLDCRLFIRFQGKITDLQSGQSLKLPDKFQSKKGLGKFSLETRLFPDKSMIPLKSNFSNLFYAVSSKPLQQKKMDLILLLGILCILIFFMTFGATFFIAKRVSEPLENMADQALAIARSPSEFFLSEKMIRYVEFRKLGRAFNQVLQSLLKAQEELQSQAQNEIEAKEKRYQTLVETSPTGIFSMDLQGKILFANQTLEEMVGYSLKELQGMTFCDLVALDAMDESLKKWIFEWKEPGLKKSYEVCWTQKGGQLIWVELRAARITEGGKELVLVNAMDVTERKQAEEEVRESEEKYRSVINQSRDCIYLVDPKTKRVIEANPAMQKLLGYSEEEILNLTVYDFTAHEKGDIDQKIQDIVSNREYAIGERCCKKKDNEIVYVDASANVISYGGKELLSLVCRDITERKKIEDELLKVQKLESVGILAGGIAHDFNNILTGIIGNLSLAKNWVDPEEKVYKYIDKSEAACFRAKDLTQQLLTFARGGAPVKSSVSIAKLVKESAEFTLRGSNVDIRFLIQEDLWSVDVDAGQISQVINNLTLNAVQAMPEGGRITIRAKNVDLDKSKSIPLSPGKYVFLSIEDKGEGIPKKELSKIFDPYFTTKEMGHGLGLAMVFSIINRHRGHISVESTPGKGTVFLIYLPASLKQSHEAKKERKSLAMGAGKILVMDDEDELLEVVQEALTHLGYGVVPVKDGEEAIQAYKEAMAENSGFDLVILDLTVPGGMGGRETIRELLKIDPQVRGIVSSGYSQDPVMGNYKDYGFVGVLSKPYKIAELGKVLNECLQEGPAI